MHLDKRLARYLIFFGSFLLVLLLSHSGEDFIIAPPYGVSLYLVVCDSNSRYSQYSCITFSYLLVITTTFLIHTLLGDTIYTMTLNVFLISLLMTLTGLVHPPAIALTIFTFLIKNVDSVALFSLLFLIIILVLRFILSMEPVKSRIMT